MICAGTGCVANGSLKVKDALETELIKRNLQNEVKIVLTGCNGFCAKGPVMVVYPEDIFYQLVKPEDVPHLVEEHFIKGRPVQKFLYTPPAQKDAIPVMNEIPFFKHQVLRALRNRSLIDAEKIEEYIARDGYMAAAKALTEMTPEQIVTEMKKSGLRGRGGAGFLTGLKWELCARVPGDIKYILCNGDEGDPGAFMDRSVMEADPHSVLEGMIIAAKAINAHYGYIYVRAEYPLAVHRLQLAIEQAMRTVCWARTFSARASTLISKYTRARAPLCAARKRRSWRRSRGKGYAPGQAAVPGYQGLWQRPSVLNNVETFANIRRSYCTARTGSKPRHREEQGDEGRAVGALNNIGLVEVPMGIPLKTVIYDMAAASE
jgi:(2Fe-2S) ferredoxin